MTDKNVPPKYRMKKETGIWGKLKIKIKNHLGWQGTPLLIPYRGYVTDKHIYISGYLTEEKGLEKPSPNDSTWENALSMLKRYASENLPQVAVNIRINSQSTTVETSNNGIFKSVLLNHKLKTKDHSRWETYTVSLTPESTEKGMQKYESGEFLVPGKKDEFGVISDIDDTIIVSHSTRILRKLWLLLFRNSRTRKPFPGVDAFYKALAKGPDGQSKIPFFYVSSSEWNLYDLLDDFCSFNGLPKGVFLLRDLETGIFSFRKSGGGNHKHKYQKIRHLFEIYPTISFILIGDNGQRDPEIYARISSEFPARVKAIYIRTVRKHKHAERDRKIQSQMQKIGVPMIITTDSTEAAKHAALNGLTSTESIFEIARDAEKDMESLLQKKVFEKE
ncbi:App1 family protein [Mangrovibacterium lignilyticum]|uniref:App1 family protein n=1 Tax=Mangrovibacterium lignilyticum TaxID=2668052 RepID=UPI0019675193|nr:phosphatase domain-containing protein [Mangrovibacterium lignilyticum]